MPRFTWALFVVGIYAVVFLAGAVSIALLTEAGWPHAGRVLGAVLMFAGAGVGCTIHDRPEELLAQRKRRGQCVRCGYALTGNVSGVCPECGGGTEARTAGGGRKAGDVP